MSTNLYHILGFIPATERFEMPPVLEALAQRLITSGKLRINADTERNFVRLGVGQNEKTLTARELNDPRLKARTREVLARHVAPAEGEGGFSNLTARLQTDLKKARGVSAEKEARIARVLVQSTEPAVIELLLTTGTEVFVSYSHNVGDLMAVHQWQNEGTASGLQATETEGTAVYVSAGGDPFFEGEQKHYITDGFPALARMVVIAGQELGHFADLRRHNGRILGRHSTDSHHMELRANPVAGQGRLKDMAHLSTLMSAYRAAGLDGLRAAEQSLAFYDKRRKFSPPWCWHQLRRLILRIRFHVRCNRLGIARTFRLYPRHRHGKALSLFLSDMEFNLAPDADVYRNPNPLVEEAIAVIEAVARVPQQVHKWGHANVAFAWPQLYAFYYGTIIPGVKASVPHAPVPQKLTKPQWLIAKWRRARRPKPGYYP